MTSLAIAGIALLSLLCTALILLWLRWGLKKLELPEASRARILMRTLLAIAGWLILTGVLAGSGFLAQWRAKPPHMPLVPLAALISIVCINRTALFRRLLQTTPRHWPVAMQTFRIGVELCFWALYTGGGAPVQVTFEGRNFDVLVGLTAPLIALAIAKLNLGSRSVIVWNVCGIAILCNTIFTTFSSLPGPLHRNWPGLPFTAFAEWSFVWVPGFLAPLAILLHVFSIRQNAMLRRPVLAVS